MYSEEITESAMSLWRVTNEVKNDIKAGKSKEACVALLHSIPDRLNALLAQMGEETPVLEIVQKQEETIKELKARLATVEVPVIKPAHFQNNHLSAGRTISRRDKLLVAMSRLAGPGKPF